MGGAAAAEETGGCRSPGPNHSLPPLPASLPPSPARPPSRAARARALGSAKLLPAPRCAGGGSRTVRIQNGGAPRPPEPARSRAARCGPAEPGDPREGDGLARGAAAAPARGTGSLEDSGVRRDGPARHGLGTAPRCLAAVPGPRGVYGPIPNRASSTSSEMLPVFPGYPRLPASLRKLFTCPPCPHSAFPRPRVLFLGFLIDSTCVVSQTLKDNKSLLCSTIRVVHT